MTRTILTMTLAALVALPASALAASDEELREAIRERAQGLFDELDEMEREHRSRPAPEAEGEAESTPAPAEEPPAAVPAPESVPEEPAAPPAPSAPAPSAHAPKGAAASGGGVTGVIRDVASAVEGGVRSVGSSITGIFGGGASGTVRVEVTSNAESDAEREEALREIETFVTLAREKAAHRERHKQMIEELAHAKAERDLAQAAAQAATQVKTTAPPPRRLDPARERTFRIGFEGHGAFGPGSTRGDPKLMGIYGGDLALNVAPFLALGVGTIGVSKADDEWSITAAPYVELFFFIGDWLQLYGQGGVATQFRLNDDEDGVAGAAAFGGLGARFWIGSHFSVGPAVKTYVVVTDRFAFADQQIPRDGVVITGGADCHLHF